MTDLLMSLIKIKDRYFTTDRLEDLKSVLSGAPVREVMYSYYIGRRHAQDSVGRRRIVLWVR